MASEPLRLRIAPDVIFEAIEDEILVLDLREDQYYAFEGIGSRVWQLIAETGDVAAVLARLKDEFDVAESVLADDVREFVGELRRRGLVLDDEVS